MGELERKFLMSAPAIRIAFLGVGHHLLIQEVVHLSELRYYKRDKLWP